MTDAPASMTPLFGRTQYLRGAVVFTLKHTLLSEGFFSLRLVVTTSVKGPDGYRMTNTSALLFLHFDVHSTVATPPQHNCEWKLKPTKDILRNISLKIYICIYTKQCSHH